MRFTEEEDAKFWPVYREYETALAKINDDRIALIKEYADSYDTLTDATADEHRDARARASMRGGTRSASTYYDRFKKVVAPPRRRRGISRSRIRFFCCSICRSRRRCRSSRSK